MDGHGGHGCRQVDVRVYLADVVREAVGDAVRARARVGGTELGVSARAVALHQQPPDHQAEEQQQPSRDGQRQVQVQLLLIFCGRKYTTRLVP